VRDNFQAYKVWAPDGARWTQWAKPVMFMDPAETLFPRLVIPEVDWLQGLESDTMIVADLPGERGVINLLQMQGYSVNPVYR